MAHCKSKPTTDKSLYLVLLSKEGQLFFLRGIGHRQDVPQRDVLEAICLADVVVWVEKKRERKVIQI